MQQVPHQLRVAIIVIAIAVVIIFGLFLVRKHAPQAAVVEQPTPPPPPEPKLKTSRGTVIPDDMASVAHRHVAFNPVVEVMQDIPAGAATFPQEYRTDSGTRARKRQAAADNSGGFQESELFARLAQDAPYMAPLSSQTEFQQSTMGEERPLPMH